MGSTAGIITAAEAVTLVNGVIEELAVGPERVMAADPARVAVDWDAHVSGARYSKVMAVRTAIRVEMNRYLHQMPQVLLVAEDGVVTAIFGQDIGTKVA
jgi:hypothetical protein